MPIGGAAGSVSTSGGTVHTPVRSAMLKADNPRPVLDLREIDARIASGRWATQESLADCKALIAALREHREALRLVDRDYWFHYDEAPCSLCALLATVRE